MMENGRHNFHGNKTECAILMLSNQLGGNYDNVHTATHIAKECGILTPNGIAIEGPEFNKMTDEEIKQRIPHLQVLARSSPNDKFRLVRLLQEMDEVVAVTGDGTNDAPALK